MKNSPKDSVFVLLHSTDIKDINAFLKLFSLFIEPEYKNQGKGQKAASFKLIVKKDHLKLKEDSENNFMQQWLDKIESLENENSKLKKKNNYFRNELEALAGKQDLSVNETLQTAIVLLRNDNYSFQEIANHLNEEGFTNSRGKTINSMLVSRLYKKSLIGEG